MRAVVVEELGAVAVRERPDPELLAPTDALLRITSSAICGTDLHIYEGRFGDVAGLAIGHEPLGVVEEVGPAVVSVRPGDRVVVPTHICCGFCSECVASRTAACLTTNPGAAGAAYGYPGMGGYEGAQAELLRVPFADMNCLLLPGEPGDELEDDFVLLADAFPTGYHAAALAGVGSGDSVAIFGAGAVGLLAGISARMRGAGEVFVVDCVPERLERAGDLGFTPVDFTAGDPVEAIGTALREAPGARARRGEEAAGGVDCGIDAIGFQARDREDPEAEDPAWVLAALARLVKVGGRIALIGVYLDSDAGAQGPRAQGVLPMPVGQLFKKGITVAMGRDHDMRYNRMLREVIVRGQARPSLIVSHRLPLEQAPEAFRLFDRREAGYLKVVLDPRAAR